MASLRKRYQGRVETSPRQDGPPVTTAQTGAAKLPDAVADPKPPEMAETESPVDAAAKNALRERLREMENAEALSRRQPQQQPHAAEPQQQQQPPLEEMIAHLPERVQRWYRSNPEWLTNPEKAAQIQYVHHVARREVGEEFTDPYFDRMEQMLGLAPRANGQSQHRPPAPAAPVRQQQRRNVPMSAPPTREAPSMSTGRPASRRAPLTAEEVEAARFSGITPERYAEEKEKMLRLRAAGQLDDRG